MAEFLENWRAQIRKGYLELCILLLVQKYGRLYGLELIEKLRELELEVKEGTLYPLLSRMSEEQLLKAQWETEGAKGHPRKFYSLSKEGQKQLALMESEFAQLIASLELAKGALFKTPLKRRST